jgi:hypothetical protein
MKTIEPLVDWIWGAIIAIELLGREVVGYFHMRSPEVLDVPTYVKRPLRAAHPISRPCEKHTNPEGVLAHALVRKPYFVLLLPVVLSDADVYNEFGAEGVVCVEATLHICRNLGCLEKGLEPTKGLRLERRGKEYGALHCHCVSCWVEAPIQIIRRVIAVTLLLHRGDLDAQGTFWVDLRAIIDSVEVYVDVGHS